MIDDELLRLARNAYSVLHGRPWRTYDDEDAVQRDADSAETLVAQFTDCCHVHRRCGEWATLPLQPTERSIRSSLQARSQRKYV